MRSIITAVSLSLLATPLLQAQQVMSDYLEVFTVKIRPEKRTDFDSVNRKIAEVNRKAKGDKWTAMEVEYGEGNTVQFVSQRENYAGIESGMTAFMSAANTAYGPGGAAKMMADFNSTILSSRSEIRRRRWDLTVNPPSDADSYNNIIGSARWIRTIKLNVRNGREEDFEQRAKEAKAALEKGSKWTYFISEVLAGTPGNVYYVTTLQPSLAAFDAAPKMNELMGQEAFGRWSKAVSEDTLTSETMMLRMMPELSNVPEGVTKIAPDFWQMKRVASAGHAVPKMAETAKASQ